MKLQFEILSLSQGATVLYMYASRYLPKAFEDFAFSSPGMDCLMSSLISSFLVLLSFKVTVSTFRSPLPLWSARLAQAADSILVDDVPDPRASPRADPSRSVTTSRSSHPDKKGRSTNGPWSGMLAAADDGDTGDMLVASFV